MLNPNPSKFHFVTAYYVGPSRHIADAYAVLTEDQGLPTYAEAVEQFGRCTNGHSEGQADHKCDHCGAIFHHGVLYREQESGKLWQIGHQCSDSTFSCADRAELIRKRAEKAAKRAKQAEAWKAAGFHKFLEKADEEICEAHDFIEENRDQIDPSNRNHQTMLDILEKMKRWGDWSERQESYFKKLAMEFFKMVRGLRDEPKPEEEKQPIPEELLDGRQEITGKIVSIKWHESEYAGRYVEGYKIVVKDDRGFAVWGSLPSGFNPLMQGEETGRVAGVLPTIGDYDESEFINPEASNTVKRGTRVSFFAKINKSDRDESFGFFKRPSKFVKLS